VRRQQRGVIFLLLFPLVAFATNYVHWQGDYDKALQQAHQEHKPLLVLVVKDDTPLCNKIIQTTFMNQPYVDRINGEMIAVIVTYEGKLSYPIELYYTTHFPTLFWVDSSSETFLSPPLYERNISIEKMSLLLVLESV
jgi:hypothetical protein